MELFDREKRDRIYAHAFAQAWQERLDDFRKAGRAAPQMTYGELLNLAFALISASRQKELGESDKCWPEEVEAFLKELDEIDLGAGPLGPPFRL